MTTQSTRSSTYTELLVRSSYGFEADITSNGPYESVLKHLMLIKSSYLYPKKQALVTLQFKLIHAAQQLKSHAGAPQESEKMLTELKKFQSYAKKIILKISAIEKSFKSYEKDLDQKVRYDFPRAVNTLIEALEAHVNQSMTADLKALLFDSDGMPLSYQHLTNLLTERGISCDEYESDYGKGIAIFTLRQLNHALSGMSLSVNDLDTQLFDTFESTIKQLTTIPQDSLKQDNFDEGGLVSASQQVELLQAHINTLPATPAPQSNQTPNASPKITSEHTAQAEPGSPISSASLGGSSTPDENEHWN